MGWLVSDGMSLTDEEQNRLADIVELQPTKNGELQDRWGLDSGSEVHQYLEGHLKDYYYRDDDSLIRSTPEAVELTDVEPGVAPSADGEDDDAPPSSVRLSPLETKVFETVAGPEGDSQSVVSVLNGLRDAYDIDPDVETVRQALQRLKRIGVVEVIYRAVPTFRACVDRDAVSVSTTEQ
jgi:hypothetical protein